MVRRAVSESNELTLSLERQILRSQKEWERAYPYILDTGALTTLQFTEKSGSKQAAIRVMEIRVRNSAAAQIHASLLAGGKRASFHQSAPL